MKSKSKWSQVRKKMQTLAHWLMISLKTKGSKEIKTYLNLSHATWPAAASLRPSEHMTIDQQAQNVKRQMKDLHMQDRQSRGLADLHETNATSDQMKRKSNESQVWGCKRLMNSYKTKGSKEIKNLPQFVACNLACRRFPASIWTRHDIDQQAQSVNAK